MSKVVICDEEDCGGRCEYICTIPSLGTRSDGHNKNLYQCEKCKHVQVELQ